MCDGGQHFWGVEYYPDSGRFDRLSINGTS
jgi:hypothetical protein